MSSIISPHAMEPIEQEPQILTSEAASEGPAAAESDPPKYLEDFDAVMNAAFCESFTTHQRFRNEAGEWRWREPGERPGEWGPAKTIDQLPQLRGTRFAVCELLDDFCTQVTLEWKAKGLHDQLLWTIQITAREQIEDSRVYGVMIARRVEGFPSPQIIAMAGHEDAALAVALAMINLNHIELPTYHRELFPHRYADAPSD